MNVCDRSEAFIIVNLLLRVISEENVHIGIGYSPL